MMQQVAAKSSDIAALPIEVDVNTSTPSGDTDGALFADLLHQSNQQSKSHSTTDEANIPEEQPEADSISKPVEHPTIKDTEQNAAPVQDDKTRVSDDPVLSERESPSTAQRAPIKPESAATSIDVTPVQSIEPDIKPVEAETKGSTDESDRPTLIADAIVNPVVQNKPDSSEEIAPDDILSLVEFVRHFPQAPDKGNLQNHTQGDNSTSYPSVTERIKSYLQQHPESTASAQQPELLTRISDEALEAFPVELGAILGQEPSELVAISDAIINAKITPEGDNSVDFDRVITTGEDIEDNELLALTANDLFVEETNPVSTIPGPDIAETATEKDDAWLKLAELVNQAVDSVSSETQSEIGENEDAIKIEDDAAILKQIVTVDSPKNTVGIEVENKTQPVQVSEAELNSRQKVDEVNVETLLAGQSEPVQTASIQRIAEAVVTSVPSPAPQLQEQVKGALNSAVAEITKQIEQGHEPGINLEDVIAQTLTENGVTVTPQLTAHIEQHVAQTSSFLNIAQHIADARYALDAGSSTDVSVGETTRLQVETQHSQQQTQQIDKAVNFHTPEGKQQINEKIRWMVNARQSMAEIRLDPPELGSMQVRVNVSGDAASVSFVVQSQVARDAIADAMPKLREMLSEQGIDLGEAFVQQQDRQNQHDAQEQGFASGQHEGFDFDDEESTVIEQHVTRDMKGGVDAYA